MAFDKAGLFKPRLAEREVALPGFPEPVRIRALTRDEVVRVRDAHMHGPDIEDLDVISYENELTSLALVDPALTPEEVAQWSEAAPAGELSLVMDEIRSLSAMDEEAAKSGVPGNRRERRAAVRARPGRAAG